MRNIIRRFCDVNNLEYFSDFFDIKNLPTGFSCIYILYTKKDKHIYVGETENLYARFNRDGILAHHAIAKMEAMGYLISDIEIDAIEVTEDREARQKLEKNLIKLLKESHEEYNIINIRHNIVFDSAPENLIFELLKAEAQVQVIKEKIMAEMNFKHNTELNRSVYKYAFENQTLDFSGFRIELEEKLTKKAPKKSFKDLHASLYNAKKDIQERLDSLIAEGVEKGDIPTEITYTYKLVKK